MATEKVSQAATTDDEATLNALSCMHGARGIIELVATEMADEDSRLAANPAHAEQCLRGVMRLLESAETHIGSIGRKSA